MFKIPFVSLSNPFPNGATEEEGGEDAFKLLIDTHAQIKQMWENGERIYVGITEGDRKGSTAYIAEIETPDHIEVVTRWQSPGWREPARCRVNAGFHCVLAWEDRRNKIKWWTGSKTVFFPGHVGPTVWEKFDAKAAAKKIAENVDVEDRYGNVLAEGDSVLYINARYGHGARLDRGTVERIQIKAHRYRGKVTYENIVHILSETLEKSEIKRPELSIIKE